MKKILLIVLLLSAGLIVDAKLNTARYAKASCNTVLNFKIYAGSNYNYAVYEDAFASVQITVNRISGNRKEQVYSKTVSAMQINRYPAEAKAMNLPLNACGYATDNTDAFEITISIVYDYNGSILVNEAPSIIVKNRQLSEIPVAV